MTALEEWFAKYFAAEYLNVQNPEAFRAQAWEELQKILQPQ